MNRRGSGVLLHVTSLPSPHGIGDLGPDAYRFVDFLQASGQRYWQILPLNPTNVRYDSAPYHSTSAFAFNPLLISPELLVERGLLEQSDLRIRADYPENRVDFPAVVREREKWLDKACARFLGEGGDGEYHAFCRDHGIWLEDFALFIALRAHHGGKPWNEWPEDIRDREAHALDGARRSLAPEMEKIKVLQFLFYRQWLSLKRYCTDKGIQVIGDLPIYVEYDSVELWAHGEIFKLDEANRAQVVAGVPPDYFSETGQLWGNPIYHWDRLKEKDFDWWIRRIEHNLKLFDLVRIDHFRGLVACWEVPAEEETALNGQWVEAPVYDLFNRLHARNPDLPLIAEDLGHITQDVRDAIEHFKLPGMKPLLFAFSGNLPENPYIPHNLTSRCVAYTGTHDNNTSRGWFEKEASPEELERLFEYLGRPITAEEVSWELIRLVMLSVAEVAILPMQDLLGLGEEARMNRPSTKKGNWHWRLSESPWTPDLVDRLKALTRLSGRC